MTAPRTILYVGNFTKPWCTEVHVAASLESLGHTVIRQQENETSWSDLPLTATQTGAHMLLWTRTWPAEMDVVLHALHMLRDAGIPTVSYHLDRWFGLDREHQVRDQPFFHTALVVSPDDSPRWADEGVNHHWMPPGVYDAECEPVAPDRQTYPHDVIFVGSYPYPHPEWADYRRGLIETMQRRFGRRFQVWPIPRRPLRGRDLQTLYASAKVVVGDSCLAGESHRYWSDRIPETLGRGGLLIHPWVEGGVGSRITPGLSWYEGGEHLLGYTLGDFGDAADQAEYALDNTHDFAQTIRDQGRALVLGRDTYRHRMEALLIEVERQFGWPDDPKTVPSCSYPNGPCICPLVHEAPFRLSGKGEIPRSVEMPDSDPEADEVLIAQIMESVTVPIAIERLEIGSGSFPTEGFTHLDIDPAAPGVDIVGPAFPLDLADGSVGEIRAVDVLEHLSYRDTDAALAEWARVLRPGGGLYVQVPDADTIMRWYVEEPDRLVDRLPDDLPQTALAGATWRLLGGHADGVQGAGDVDFRLNAHYAMFSMESLVDALDDAGFAVEVERNAHPNLCARATRR